MSVTIDQILKEASRTPWLPYTKSLRDKITNSGIGICDLYAIWSLHKGNSLRGVDYNTRRKNLKRAGMLFSYDDPTGQRELNGKKRTLYGITPEGELIINRIAEVIGALANKMNKDTTLKQNEP